MESNRYGEFNSLFTFTTRELIEYFWRNSLENNTQNAEKILLRNKHVLNSTSTASHNSISHHMTCCDETEHDPNSFTEQSTVCAWKCFSTTSKCLYLSMIAEYTWTYCFKTTTCCVSVFDCTKWKQRLYGGFVCRKECVTHLWVLWSHYIWYAS